jgi:DNA-directed RNA polymerase subunit beta
LRPSEPPTERNTRQLVYRLLLDPKRYDLAKVGRYKINRKLNFSDRILDKIAAEDIVDPNSNKKILKAEEKINRKIFSAIINLGIEKVKVLNFENETVTVFNEKDEAFVPIVDKLSEEINEDVFIDAIIVEDIINPKTGEVICSAGKDKNKKRSFINQRGYRSFFKIFNQFI